MLKVSVYHSEILWICGCGMYDVYVASSKLFQNNRIWNSIHEELYISYVS
jgi:hypothetical protein